MKKMILNHPILPRRENGILSNPKTLAEMEAESNMTDPPDRDGATARATVDWYRSAPWWRLVSQTVVLAWRASHLFLCAVALVATWLLTTFSFWIFQPEQIAAQVSWVTPTSSVPAMAPFDRDLAEVVLAMSGTDDRAPGSRWYSRSSDSFLQVWRRFLHYPFQALESLTLRRSAYLLFNTLAVVAVWAFAGGCIARRSIQEFGTRITAPWTDTVSLVTSRWTSIAWASWMPAALILMCASLPWLLGCLSNIPVVGPWVSGLLMVPLALLSVGLGWCAAVTIFGYSLAVAAIVCEKKADAFDGVSRAAAYSFQKPVTLILAVIAAEWIGHFAGGMVSIALNTGFAVLARAFELGSFQTLTGQGTFWDIFFDGFVPLMVTAFGFSFFWTASAAIYLILRREVDHAEFDLIDMDAPGAPKALPPLPAGGPETTEAANSQGSSSP